MSLPLVQRSLLIGLVALALFAPSCGGEPEAPAAKPAGPAKKAPPRGKKAAATAAPADSTPLPVVDPSEFEFSESERSRDPFRSFEAEFGDKTLDLTATEGRPDVILADIPVDDLKLQGIILNASPSVAMLVDSKGKGHTVTRGMYVGRSELVQGVDGGPAYEVNWRIDMIRDSSIVLIRFDPSNPDVPAATKVILLHPDEATAEL